jgi:hypothetical protein
MKNKKARLMGRIEPGFFVHLISHRWKQIYTDEKNAAAAIHETQVYLTSGLSSTS